MTALVFALTILLSCTVTATDLSVRIELSGSTAIVTGSFLDKKKFSNQRNLSFIGSVAGIDAPPNRIAEVSLFDADGRKLGFRRLSDREYLSAEPIDSWSYQVNLGPISNINSKAHLSWVEEKKGILNLRDSLPEVAIGTSAKVELIFDSKIMTAAKPVGNNVFEVSDVGNAVFFLGATATQRNISASSSRIKLVVDGQWQTDIEEAVRAVSEIFDYYERIYGSRPTADAVVFLGKFPVGTAVGRWAAETRGVNVTIFSSEMNFQTQSVQKLHEQLRHEIFHLWFPNSLNLSGNYDWFYEGFALYSALKTAVAMNRIRFDDFLDTLSRANNIEGASRRRMSLIDAAINRWNGANTQIYARGMIVAFLVDAAILRSSKGRESLDDLMSELYKKHGHATPRTDANTAILNFFGAREELRPVIDSYIKSAPRIDWTREIQALGIEPVGDANATKLRVMSKLDRRQKDLLDKLGYNNWRKTSK